MAAFGCPPRPEGFPQEFRAAYLPDSKQLVVDYDLPAPEIVPPVVEHRYAKAKHEIQTKPRKPAEIREVYQGLVAAVTLRTCHELFESDQAGHLDVVAFNGFVHTVDARQAGTSGPVLSLCA